MPQEEAVQSYTGPRKERFQEKIRESTNRALLRTQWKNNIKVEKMLNYNRGEG